jgi:Cu2+-exporting ATPase
MQVSCFHCGLPVPAGTHHRTTVLGTARDFCCAGCRAVAETIVADGLDAYYLDRERRAENPGTLDASLSALLAYDHPSAQKEFVQHRDELASVELTIEHLNCAACAWLIEKTLARDNSVREATVNLSTQRLHLCWDDTRAPLSHLLTTLARIGYPARPYRADEHAAQLQAENQQLLKRLAVAGLGMMQVMMYAGAIYVGAYQGIEAEYRHYLNWTNLLITTPVFFYAGAPFHRSAWRVLRARRLNMDVPVSLALTSAYLASVYATVTQQGDSYFDSVTMFIFFLLTSHFLEARARQRAGDTASRLMASAPRLATRLQANDAGKESAGSDVVAAADLQPGDRILVKPGETVPADGIVLEGHSAVSEALLTGEPLPLPRQAGDAVLGGSLNTEGSLVIRVSRDAADSTLGTLNRLLNRALAEKPRLARRADELAQVFVGIVLLLSVIVFAAWTHADNAQHAFWITLAVLVATCPCALSLATPMALTSATNALAESGFLLTRGHVLETLAEATHVVFDKTGTLTEGRLQLQSISVLRGDEAGALKIVRALEQRSEHPVARAFQTVPNDALPLVQNLQQQTGSGVSGDIDGRTYRFGHAAFALPGTLTSNTSGKLWLADDDGAIAAFMLSDTLRPEAAAVIADLQARGLQTWLLSGDPSPAALDMGRELHMQVALGGMTPSAKREKVRALQAEGAVVVMVGDGVNDAPVLAQAHLSIAMASASDLAQVSADSLLLHNDLRRLPEARDMALKTRRIVRQNLCWALAYNLAVLPPAALGWLPPWAAALGMSLSSLLVVGNALRLHKVTRPSPVKSTLMKVSLTKTSLMESC